MDNKTYNIELLVGEKRIKATITHEFIDTEVGLSGDCQLTLKCGEKRMIVVDDDFFNALIQIRERLEPQGVLFNIYGASLNVWVSGMSASMSAGLVGYKFENDDKTTVNIFNTGDDVIPSTISVQRDYSLKCINDLISRAKSKSPTPANISVTIEPKLTSIPQSQVNPIKSTPCEINEDDDELIKIPQDKKPVNHGLPWTQLEDIQISTLYQNGVSINKIAHEHQRSKGSIHSRLSKLGLINS